MEDEKNVLWLMEDEVLPKCIGINAKKVILSKQISVLSEREWSDSLPPGRPETSNEPVTEPIPGTTLE